MNEFIYAEFLFEDGEATRGAAEIRELGDDFILISSDTEYDPTDISVSNVTFQSDFMLRVYGQIRSETATMITLSNKFLSERMRVSYISDEMKNKYRR